MFRLAGEKLYLPSGIASAASTTCFSIALISASSADATVSGGGGMARLVALPGQAVMAHTSTAGSATIRMVIVEAPFRRDLTHVRRRERQVVPVAVRRVKELRLVRVGFDLLAQPQDGLVHGPVRVRHVRVAPDDPEQLVAMHDAVRALREIAEHRELPARQLDRFSRIQRARVLEVDRHVRELQTEERGARPPEDRENAR